MARNPLKAKPSDDALEAEIVKLREEERAFRREHARLREAAHHGVDVSIAAARAMFEKEAAKQEPFCGLPRWTLVPLPNPVAPAHEQALCSL